jgi:DnaJ-domain-containing protein 1
MTTYYDILGVEPTATAGEIKAAYRRLAMRFHPDRNVGANKAVQRLNEEKFKEIQEAYDTLKDEIKREEYDAAIEMLSSGEYYEPQPTPPPSPEKPRYCHKCRNPVSTRATAADELCPFCGSPLQSSPPPNREAQRPPWHRQTSSTKQRVSSKIPVWLLVWLMLGAINSIIGPLSPTQDSSNPSSRQTNGNSQVIVKHTPAFEPVPQIIVPLVTSPYPPTVTGNTRTTSPQRLHSGRTPVGEPKKRDSNKIHRTAPATRAAREAEKVLPGAAREPRAYNLSKLTWDDQKSLEAACAYDKTQGPVVYHRCLEDQLGRLATAPPMPDLSKLSSNDRQSIELACAYNKTQGPAAYHRCVIRQLGQ